MIANIFFGSKEESREELEDIINPYSHKVVAQYPLCSAEDTQRALKIAQNASIATKASTIAQRVSWLEDVVLKLTYLLF